MRARVALTRGRARYESVAAALERIAKDVHLERRWRVVVKPNLGRADRQLAATHVDAVRAVLDFVRARWDGPVAVAEGSARGPTHTAFRQLGYEDLVPEFDVDLVDLNADETVPVRVWDRELRPLRVEVARTLAMADFRISVCPPKTHDAALVALGIENMVRGSLAGREHERAAGARLGRLAPAWVRHSRLAAWSRANWAGRKGGPLGMALHQGPPLLNLNLARLAPHVWPQLTVIDGWRAMEGEGPGTGDPVRWRVALAGTDALAVDVLASHLMGIDPEHVGYLQHCRRLGLGRGDLEEIDVTGNLPVEQARRRFVAHPTWRRQLAWRIEEADRLLIAP